MTFPAPSSSDASPIATSLSYDKRSRSLAFPRKRTFVANLRASAVVSPLLPLFVDELSSLTQPSACAMLMTVCCTRCAFCCPKAILREDIGGSVGGKTYLQRPPQVLR